ncbi:MAG: hypothetical protein ACI9SB_001082 [Candidatus Azotimanducaceae bacterium]|jgi:hypothetical protein
MKTNNVHIIYLAIAVTMVAFLALTFTVRAYAAPITAPAISMTTAASHRQ